MANSQQNTPAPQALKAPLAPLPEHEAMQAYIAQQKILKEYKEFKDAEQSAAERVEMAKQQIENWKKQQSMVENAQAGCSHLKEDGRRLNIVGQKDHAGRMIDICQRCQKVWNGALGQHLEQHLANYPRGNETVGMIH